MKLSRRALIQHAGLAGAALATLRALPAPGAEGHDTDWNWLVGSWDVHNERLRGRLENSTTWDKFGGKTSCQPALGGFGNVDDCLLYLPSGTYRAFAPRAFDPATNQWSIWWLDGRMAGRLDPPVHGSFNGTEGEFHGKDVHKDIPVDVRFRWHETHSQRPWWDQSFSTDQGKTWEVNWRNYFTRVSATPAMVPLDPGEKPHAAAGDWQFIAGKWKVRNRRRKADGQWEEFPSTLHNWPVMGGLGNVGDNVFHAPGGTYRGLSMRAFDAARGQWHSWWLDGRRPSEIDAPISGTFADGVATLTGAGVRSRWTRTRTSTPHWEQAVSTDGVNWEINWSADFERA